MASDGRPLTGAKDYVIHLPAGNLPPVKAFWSYTVYGPDSFFVANPINRYSLSGDTPGLVRDPTVPSICTCLTRRRRATPPTGFRRRPGRTGSSCASTSRAPRSSTAPTAIRQ